MRIAVVGNGRSVHTLARSAALARRGHEVRLVTLGPVLPAEGIEVRTRPIPRNVLEALGAARGFLEDVRSFGPDLLQLHYAGGKMGTMATLCGVRPLAVTVMGGDVLPEQHPGGLSTLERRATRRILEAADLILLKSEGLRPALASLGDFAARVETVRWGVDPARFRRDPAAGEALRARLGLSAEDRVILSPRILSPLYNIHLIVEAMGRVLKSEPRGLLLLTEYNADPGYRELLVRRIASWGLGERLRFAGCFDHGEMPGLYSLAEIVVSIPSSDGLPQSLFEAMACEVPAVLGRLPAYAEMVADGESSLLVDFTAESVARAIVRLMGDPRLREALAARALAQVREKALLPREVERVEGLYRELLASAPRRSPRGGRLVDALSLLLR